MRVVLLCSQFLVWVILRHDWVCTHLQPDMLLSCVAHCDTEICSDLIGKMKFVLGGLLD